MKRVHFIPIIPAGPGGELCHRVVQYGSSKSRPKIYIQAGLHANEIPGQLVAACLEDMLDQVQDHIVGHIVLVPMANPVGLGQWVNGIHLGRFEINSGVNFNRRFPDVISHFNPSVLEGLKHQDSDTIVETIRQTMLNMVKAWPTNTTLESLQKNLFQMAIDSDYVLDLHSDTSSLLHLYTDQDSWPSMKSLATSMGAKVALIENHAGGQPFDESITRPWRWLRDHGFNVPQVCKGATVELRGHRDVSLPQAQQDAVSILKCIKAWGLLNDTANIPNSGEFSAPPHNIHVCSLDSVDVIDSPCYGVVIFNQALGEYVEQGQEVAKILTYPHRSDTPQWVSVVTQTSGIIFTQSDRRYVFPGHCVAKVAGSKPLTHRIEGQLLQD